MSGGSKEVRLGISAGDVNGVGVELLLKAYRNEALFNQATPVLFADPWVVDFWIKQEDAGEFTYRVIKDPEEAKPGVLNLLPPNGKKFDLQIGQSSTDAGEYALLSLQTAVANIMNGKITNLLTLPINKHNIQSEAFSFPGHTEYLASEFVVEEYMMILAGENLKVGVLTGHIPVSKVAENITRPHLEKTLNIFIHSLQVDFMIRKPRIAVLGLNPHSGDQGLIGKEEQEIIEPVVKSFLDKGMLVYGPFAADGFFGTGKFRQFDGVLAMYHDQGLIPFKQLAFEDGVNYTAGLPAVRTSPDHGTAYNIAGKGIASIDSLVHAIYLNTKIYFNRLEYYELNKEPLEYTNFKREKFSIGVPNLK